MNSHSPFMDINRHSTRRKRNRVTQDDLADGPLRRRLEFNFYRANGHFGVKNDTRDIDTAFDNVDR